MKIEIRFGHPLFPFIHIFEGGEDVNDKYLPFAALVSAWPDVYGWGWIEVYERNDLGGVVLESHDDGIRPKVRRIWGYFAWAPRPGGEAAAVCEGWVNSLDA